MSNISPNALFHFTSKAEYLIGILTNDFIPRYCFEEVSLEDSDDSLMLSVAIPMVCFCDIPLSQITDHLKIYGTYGIGMTKEWGVKNKLNPLIYVNENSILAEAFSRLAVNITDKEFQHGEIDTKFATVSKFLKPYSGDFKRNNKILKNVKFYNEREWRYIPDFGKARTVKRVLKEEDFENSVKLAQENSKLSKYKLKFTPNDIKYIFIKDESEIHPMIEALREIKGKKFDSKTIDILASKILTVKQLEEDF